MLLVNIYIYKYIDNYWYIGILIDFYYVNEFNKVKFMLFFVFFNIRYNVVFFLKNIR